VDYSGIAAVPAGKTVSFAAGSATATVTVDPTADVEPEADETVALTLMDGPGYIIGTTSAVVGTIQNDEAQVIEAFGSTKLIRDGSNKLSAQIGSNPPVAIKYGGAQITQGMFSGWETLAAETVAGVNQVMWKNNVGNTLSLWTLDSNWAWVSSTGAWGLNSAEAMLQHSRGGPRAAGQAAGGIDWQKEQQHAQQLEGGADGGSRAIAPSRLPAHETAWAMTVHKSQGSEFDHVRLVLPDVDTRILTRELLYTGITRARERVTIVGTAATVRLATSRTVARASGLVDRLRYAPTSS
jgi:hypothetical protein